MPRKTKHTHEILDPVHGFIYLSSREREVVNSPPFQRLRHIHQLGLSYLVYPGATHRRFEHSLGVMELASQVFDVMTNEQNLTDDIRDAVGGELQEKEHWRKTVRMAALCHDMGHTPFSHATEPLLPPGTTHENITYDIIHHVCLKPIWEKMRLKADEIAKLAIGPFKLKDQRFTSWEIILAEIISGDFFGVDRMDYLLRDSHHLGVKYGQFDHNRVIQSLRLLVIPPKKEEEENYDLVPTLGIEEGGLGATEGMILARHLMYSQVYTHPICQIYEIHLREFTYYYLKEQYSENGFYPSYTADLLSITDNEIMAALATTALDKKQSGHQVAECITNRNHYRLVHERGWADTLDKKHKEGSIQNIFEDISKKFGQENCRHAHYHTNVPADSFFVKKRNGEIVSAYDYSQILKKFPVIRFNRLYVAPSIAKKVRALLDRRRDNHGPA